MLTPMGGPSASTMLPTQPMSSVVGGGFSLPAVAGRLAVYDLTQAVTLNGAGTLVTAMPDIGGNAHHIGSSGAETEQPDYSPTGFNSARPSTVMLTDESHQLLSGPGALTGGSTSWTFFIAWEDNGLVGSKIILSLTGDGRFFATHTTLRVVLTSTRIFTSPGSGINVWVMRMNDATDVLDCFVANGASGTAVEATGSPIASVTDQVSPKIDDFCPVAAASPNLNIPLFGFLDGAASLADVNALGQWITARLELSQTWGLS